jgi:NAD(P)H-nitrite reductase large subunit
LVIIGNSAAGLAAVEAVRSRDRRCRVTLIGAEPHLPYSRIMLTYLLGGRVGGDELFLHGPEWYPRMRVEALVGCRAVAIDTRRGQVVVEKASSAGTSRRVAYDRLLIATGALAQRPAISGIDRPGVFCLRDLDDALGILKYAESCGMLNDPRRRAGAIRRGGKGPQAVFLGGGPVCVQALAGLADRGMRVTLVVQSQAILSQLADPHTAGLAEKVLRAGGVRIVRGAEPVGIEERPRAEAGGRAASSRGRAADGGSRLMVHTRDGRRLPADLIIIGKGTQPNLELARGTKIATDVGILVDGTMETSVPGVFAAGDVAQARHCVSGRRVCFGTWSNACEQGRIAGLNMAGRHTEWGGGLNRNVTTLFGNTLGSVGVFGVSGEGDGRPDPEYAVHSHQDRRRGVSRRLVFRGGRCQGAVLWNSCDDLGVLSWLISTGRDCRGWEDRLARGESSLGEALRRGLVYGPGRRR